MFNSEGAAGRIEHGAILSGLAVQPTSEETASSTQDTTLNNDFTFVWWRQDLFHGRCHDGQLAFELCRTPSRHHMLLFAAHQVARSVRFPLVFS